MECMKCCSIVEVSPSGSKGHGEYGNKLTVRMEMQYSFFITILLQYGNAVLFITILLQYGNAVLFITIILVQCENVVLYYSTASIWKCSTLYYSTGSM